MSAYFTGERVVPGQVEADLWNEHMSRYGFATRLARRKRVLDLGCGAGYGSAQLAEVAQSVIGVDIAAEATAYGREHYQARNLQFLTASCATLPLAPARFDLVVAFEVIEHIVAWKEMLLEARRVLAPNGQFIVSTPNIHYYAETRRHTGPNQFHEHEFEFTEFAEELKTVFPNVSLFLQNHAEALVFQPLESTHALEARLEGSTASPADAHFFLAVCANAHQTGSPTFVYIPTTANVLREREQHIDKLQGELLQKNQWLCEAQEEHQQLLAEHHKLLEMFRDQTAELEKSNRWAEQLQSDLHASNARVLELQQELEQEQAAAAATVAGYEAKVADLDRENEAKTLWAQETERRLTAELKAKCDELAKCVDILHQVEAERDERSAWAADLQQQLDQLRADLEQATAKLGMIQTSRWVRLGRVIGIGPNLAPDAPRS